MKRIFIVFLFYHFGSMAGSQTDSLVGALGRTQDGKARTELLLQILHSLKPDDSLGRYKYVQQALREGRKASYPEGMAEAGRQLMLWYNRYGMYDSSLAMLNDLKSELQRSGWKKQAAQVTSNLGSVYQNMFEYNPALEKYLEAQRIFEELKDSASMSKTYFNIATIYRNIGNHKDAYIYYDKSKAISERLGDMISVAECMMSKGILYKKELQFDKAMAEYLPALKISEEHGDKRLLSKLYNNIGNVFLEQEIWDKAISYYKRAIVLRKELDDVNGLIITLSNWAIIMTETGKPDSAIHLLNECLHYNRQINNRKNYMDVYDELATAYAAIGDHKKAYEYSRLYTLYRDTLVNESNNESLLSLEKKYESERKDREIFEKNAKIEVQNAEAKTDAIIRYVIIGFLIVALILVVVIYRGYRNKQKAANIIAMQKRVVEAQKAIVEEQKLIVEEKNKEIMDSIIYASRIQNSLMPKESFIKRTIERLNNK